MHYHNVFLVNAKNKADAKRKVEEFLEPFGEHIKNEATEWDGYQFGGRWMWSDLIKKNIDKIVKPGTNYYWNPYRDEEVKGKTWTLELPDGSKMELAYGDEYSIMCWVHEHAELSEIIDATNPKFFNILNSFRNIESQTRWTIDARFWNITTNSQDWDEVEIRKNSKHWFLVNVDLHC